MNLVMLQLAASSDSLMAFCRGLEVQFLQGKSTVSPNSSAVQQPTFLPNTIFRIRGDFQRMTSSISSTLCPFQERGLEIFRGMPKKAWLVSCRANRHFDFQYSHHTALFTQLYHLLEATIQILSFLSCLPAYFKVLIVSRYLFPALSAFPAPPKFSPFSFHCVSDSSCAIVEGTVMLNNVHSYRQCYFVFSLWWGGKYERNSGYEQL